MQMTGMVKFGTPTRPSGTLPQIPKKDLGEAGRGSGGWGRL
jgi:hypothetical protein